MRGSQTTFAAICFITLGACADIDSVLFVTDTKIAIDADSKPPNVTIGYARDETFIGPNFETETGAIPPVVGRLESNLKIFDPQVRQIYATGRAAALVTSAEKGEVSKQRFLASDETKRLVFFRTGSNIGLKLVLAGNVPESITFGYKRKELSYIPLIRVVDEMRSTNIKEVYGSALAAIDINLNTASLSDTSLGVSQFFATGVAAEQLASNNEKIRATFQNIAAQAVSSGTYDLTDPTVACVANWLESDPDHAQELQDWWNQRGLPGFAVLQIRSVEFGPQRQSLISEKNISCTQLN